ncbi:MAG: hypothetical protein RL754_235 [Bacteroidota bacterium]|jgi:polyisoprenoid-binding protein YceI
MKKIVMFFAATALLASCNGEKAAEATTGEAQEVNEVVAESYALDSASVVAWRGFKTYVNSAHNGVVNASGIFQVEGSSVVGGKIEIDMNSIANLDIEDEGKRGYLEGHLKSADFFDVENNPTGTFEIVSVEALEGEGVNSTVTGNLTMRGTTNSISFPANIAVENGSVSFDAPTFSIDRTLWGVKFHDKEDASIAQSLKEDLIDHSIELTISVVASK